MRRTDHCSRGLFFKIFFISSVLLCLTGVVLAIGGGDSNPDLKTPQESLKHWRSLRFGTFIHWTPYILRGLDIPLGKDDGDLYKKFKAEKFDAKEWVQLFKEAGFKYVVFATKHGDGVCMWNSKVTDRNVMNTSMKRDVVGELVAECKKQGIEFCPYYNQVTEQDVHQRGSAGKFKAHVKELTENYGPFLAWWYDQRTTDWTHAIGTDFYAYVRSLQSNVLQSNRVDTCYDRGLDNPTWFVTEEKSAGDYAQSEISIPRFNRQIPWEFCRTACLQADGMPAWFWGPRGTVNPLTDWISDIVNSACRDGNFILGIGAMPDGRFEPRLVDQLRELGVWLKYYGESIYGTRGGPFKPNSWYGSTCRGNNVYLHVFKTDNGTFTLPPIDERVLHYRLINGGTVAVEQTDEGITVTIGEHDIQPIDTIVVLELDGSAEEMTPVEETILTTGADARASNVRQNKKQYSAELSVDADISTYWTTDEGVQNGWLEYDLGRPYTFSRAILDEGEEGWIRHVQIQTKVNNEWETAFEYRYGNPVLWEKIPMELFCPEFRFDAVTAQFVRVNIVSAIKSPVVYEFKLYER